MEDDGRTEKQTFASRLECLTSRLMFLTLGMAVAVAVFRILTHHPFYDECLHTRILWLVSSGLEPHRDFWCIYPVLGHVLTLPFFRALPECAWVLILLRFLMMGLLLLAGVLLAAHGRTAARRWIWGLAPLVLLALIPPVGRFLAEYSIDHFAMLAAVGAMVLFFARPDPRRVGIAAGLCVLSVLITPKYAFPLLPGMIGMCVGSVLAARRVLPTLVSVVVGAGASGGICLGLYGLGGTSLWQSVRSTHLLMAEFNLIVDPAPVTLASSSIRMLLRSVPLLLLCLAGIAGWIVDTRGKYLHRGPAPIGLLVGVVAMAFMRTYMVQYILPVLMCLTLFAPFAVRLAKDDRVARWLTAALVLITFVAAGISLGTVPSELEKTPVNVRDAHGIVAERGQVGWGPPAVKSLVTTHLLLEMIPEGELVLAAPQMHPLFRRDVTFLTVDERPSFAGVLDDDDPVRVRFDPAHLARRLEENPPAYICTTALSLCHPPGWVEVCREFLRRHADRYATPFAYPGGHLRKDLLR